MRAETMEQECWRVIVRDFSDYDGRIVYEKQHKNELDARADYGRAFLALVKAQRVGLWKREAGAQRFACVQAAPCAEAEHFMSQACRLYRLHGDCPGENTLGTSRCICGCHEHEETSR